MKIFFDFNKEFGNPINTINKNSKSTYIQEHPELQNIYICFDELIQSINIDLNILLPKPISLNVIKNLEANQKNSYYYLNNFLYFYCINKHPQPINLNLFSAILDEEKIELLKINAGYEFLNILNNFQYDIKKLNPQRLLTLINHYIPSKCLLDLNKRYSMKAHKQLSLDLLAKQLKFSRNQLNYRIKELEKQRAFALDELKNKSEIVQKLLDDPDFIISPSKIWK